MTAAVRMCVLCGGEGLERLFDLGIIPIGFPVPAADGPPVWRRLLAMAICRRCSMVQTEEQLPPDLLVTETFYTSHRSRSIGEHDRAFSEAIGRRKLAVPDSLVVEVGCGDGALLTALQAAGFRRLLGIEPSPHVDSPAGLEIIHGLFDAAMVGRLQQRGGGADLVIANHVLDGVPNPGDFIVNLAQVLSPGGLLILEIPYVVDVVRSFRLDGFVHSRNCWFTAASLLHAFTHAGLRLESFEHDESYRGGTLRALARRAAQAPLSKAVTELLAAEAAELSASRFVAFREAMRLHRERALQGLRDLTQPVYVYGGGLKAAAALNWLGLTSLDVVCAVDNDPNKQGRIVPGVNLPIQPVEVLWRQSAPIAVVDLALDHRAEVEPALLAGLPPGSTIVDVLPAWRALPVDRRSQGYT
jgi:SAM-dependent methyltransferase